MFCHTNNTKTKASNTIYVFNNERALSAQFLYCDIVESDDGAARMNYRKRNREKIIDN